ncbi:EAL domain-containing protein [Paenibacillus sp. J5C_2022]|uniref:putative bifunctional diguanylate cyclase/phosphodiesterase n=1 Tax=Paenibacillus sp. J5C2022 TaxID=2977129 RepID=UPI0021D1F51B|nr:bifunctional diguanylate cyclase/phosphodiesterase [Paenibacillus sp. J5C2022]MCU6712779.1 EAL domain-containing protein [Paenibacillus sp. J5C2022]
MVQIQGSYNGWIVALSFIIALFTSYSALNLCYRISQSRGNARLVWLAVSSIVMGSGVWTMHFVGMLAFHIRIDVQYNLPLTLLSILASVLASLLAFYVTMATAVTKTRLLSGSLLMGIGIVTMHYTGMASMNTPYMTIQYDPVLWLISAIIAVASSYAALYLFIRFRRLSGKIPLKLLAAVSMGVAIAGMHYTGMEAASFWCATPEQMMAALEQGMDTELLIAISSVMMLMIATTMLALYWERLLLKRMAYHDPLTGLPNRHAMNQFFDEKLKVGESNAVLFIDLDQFKLVNDTFGHDIGDMLVQEAGTRLQGFAKGNGRHIFRLGGDEFLVVLEEMEDYRLVEGLAEELLEELRMPYVLEGNELYVTGSVGISYSPQHGTSRSALLKAADTALYYAKSLGKNQYLAFHAELDTRLARRMEIEQGLRTALMHKQLATYYQPKWNAATNRPVGFEALLRWTHPKLGAVSPEEFIPIAEESGLIVPITRWVLEQACRDCMSWNDNGGKKLGVSVNLPVHVFETYGLNDMVMSALGNSGLPPELLELELTEAAIMQQSSEVRKQLRPLQEAGVRVSMDNFGAGNTFLGSVGSIPFHALKIDRQYMREYESPSNRAIVSSIISLASQLNVQLIAEGVETEEQLAYLREAGCSIMQGYYFKKPMPRDEVSDWLSGLTA